MTAVAFHFNAPDPLSYACRLLRKAVGAGARLVVTGEPEVLQELDAALWRMSPTDFVAHCHLASEPHVLMASPVILASSVESTPHRQVLVNLGRWVPDGFESFERLIEVVGLDEECRQSARVRWKHYAGLGHAISRHDLALKGAP